MNGSRPAGRDVDRDGVVHDKLRRGGLPPGPIAALLVAACALGLFLFVVRKDKPEPAAPSVTHGEGRAPVAKTSPAAIPTLRLANRAPIVDEGGPDEPAVEDEPLEEQTLEEQMAESKGGIHAFPAPGTKRIKAGLVVPDDFELPPGYVRHWQATDNGRMLEPILAFHPDYELVDDAGKVVPLPPGRVVPPEMAPPGLARKTLEVPKDAYATRDDEGPATNNDEGQTGHEDEDAGEAP